MSPLVSSFLSGQVGMEVYSLVLEAGGVDSLYWDTNSQISNFSTIFRSYLPNTLCQSIRLSNIRNGHLRTY